MLFLQLLAQHEEGRQLPASQEQAAQNILCASR